MLSNGFPKATRRPSAPLCSTIRLPVYTRLATSGSRQAGAETMSGVARPVHGSATTIYTTRNPGSRGRLIRFTIPMMMRIAGVIQRDRRHRSGLFDSGRDMASLPRAPFRWSVRLAPIFLALVLAPMPLAAHLALAAFIDGKLIGQH